MNIKLSRGAKIVVDRWLQIKPEDALLIVTSEQHLKEANEILRYAKQRHATVEIMAFPDQKGQIGYYFDEHEDAFDAYNAIVGATTHSLVTTRAVKRAKERGSRFLSLPLSTNDGRSMLEYEFFLMDLVESKRMGDYLLSVLNDAESIHVETEAGTNLTFRKQDRDAQFFNGSTQLCNGYASSSFEVFIPIEETMTHGIGYVDASMGYLGLPEQPVKITLLNGRIVQIEGNETGKKLHEYIQSFEDEGMYVAGEFGIGLNTHAKCSGNCYIEDESAYGTFHIGFGRNIALGGIHKAKGHFDLVFHKPDIYADNRLIMKQGQLVYESIDQLDEAIGE